MPFEHLPNETLFTIFEYLSTDYVFRAFRGLNMRFTSLLREHLRVYPFLDFRSMSAKEFDTLCKEYLPQMVDKITSLSFSDNHYMSNQFERLSTHGFTLRRFQRLQSLSFSYIYSQNTIDDLERCLPAMSTPTHLTFDKCVNPADDAYHSLLSTIWNLPNLVYLYLDFAENRSHLDVRPSLISPCIQHISASSSAHYIRDIAPLFRLTPNLRCLAAGFTISSQQISHVVSLRKLDILFTEGNLSNLLSILQSLPNLRQLKIQAVKLFVPGQVWKQLIRRYLPQLHTLQFKMEQTLLLQGDEGESYVDNILKAFREDFWLVEHTWFVQCLWSIRNESVLVYTLPCGFEQFTFREPSRGKTSCSLGSKQWPYDCVRSLDYICSSHDSLDLFDIKFFKIQHLTVHLPINDHIQLVVPDLQHLITLTASMNSDERNDLAQLQLLLNRAPHLRLLILHEKFEHTTKMLSFELHSLSVRELNLRLQHCTRRYNRQECIQLAGSTLFLQCRRLSINVVDRECAYELVLRMRNLESLCVCHGNDSKDLWKTRADGLGIWLQEHLASSAIIVKGFYRLVHIDTSEWCHEHYLFIERP